MPSAYPAAGTYFVVARPGLVNGLIRFGTRSHWSHAGINLGDGRVVEAEGSGARVSHFDEYEGLDVRVSEPAPNPDAVCARALELVGTPYGYLDIVVLSLLCLGIRLPWLVRFADSTRSLICSQLVAVAGSAGGADWLCGERSTGLVTPGDLGERLEQLWPWP